MTDRISLHADAVRSVFQLIVRLLLCFAVCLLSSAQTPDAPAARKASIRGTVRYAGWNAPVPEASVYTETPDGVVADKADAKGRYTLRDLPPGRYYMGEYEVSVLGLLPGQYVKDATYGGRSVLHAPMQLSDASTLNARLHLVIAGDGSTISAQVRDSSGKPANNVYVYALPAAANTEAELAETYTWGQTDQNGVYNSEPVPPGRYYVFATRVAVGESAAGVEKLWGARRSAPEVELGAGGARQVNLTL